MPKIQLFSIGKLRDKYLLDAIDLYVRRLRSRVALSLHVVRDDRQLVEAALKTKAPIALDAAGKAVSSEEFACLLFQELEAGGSSLSFFIGGPEGLPKDFPKESMRLSLSPLTFTNQMCRLVLVEQIYRAFEIAKGSSYHK